MSDLRQAAQQALRVACMCTPEQQIAKEALRAALAQQEQEQEPVAWLKTMYSGTRPMLEVDHLRKDTSTPVYTAPPRREWQSLSEEEIWNDDKIMAENAHCNLMLCDLVALCRAIETKLKEKNNG